MIGATVAAVVDGVMVEIVAMVVTKIMSVLIIFGHKTLKACPSLPHSLGVFLCAFFYLVRRLFLLFSMLFCSTKMFMC